MSDNNTPLVTPAPGFLLVRTQEDRYRQACGRIICAAEDSPLPHFRVGRLVLFVVGRPLTHPGESEPDVYALVRIDDVLEFVEQEKDAHPT